jgi:hypothetical protein
MNASGRLALYGAGLVVTCGVAFALAGAVVPDSVVAAWAEGSNLDVHGGGDGGTEEQAVGHTPNGVSIEADGFVLSPVEAPTTVGAEGTLRFEVLSSAGEPVTEFTPAHDKDLHLIVVRSDGTQFRHVHPVLDEVTGTWSIRWTWNEAGTYRVYADFTPAEDGAEGITLTRTVDVAGDFTPVDTAVQRIDEVDGFTVALDGDLVGGASSGLTLSVERGGHPVTTLEPYLGAFGHLVALREGDLAYLHVHPEGDEPESGATGGPEIRFTAETPTTGRYLLYLDFQVDGEVHTAEFVLDAGHGDGTPTQDDSHSGGH